MKKLLTVLIALSVVFSGFAAEPVASADMVDFSGEASVTWGYDLDTEQTGFENETDVELIINLLPGDMTKSTSGSGVWGELVLLVDGDTEISTDVPNGIPAINGSEVKVDVAKIHINDIYVGITSGDFDYSGDILFPNALNYDNGDSDPGYGMVENPNAETGFDQGIVVGYANDMFNIEGSIRSNNGTGNRHVESFTLITSDGSNGDNSPNVSYFHEDDTDTVVAYNALQDGERYYRVVFDTDSNTYWTNQYAIGGYAEFTGVENLRVGLGGSYILSGEDAPKGFGKGDSQIFVGADYVFNLSETNSIVPAVAYNYRNDNNPITDEGTVLTNNVGIGVAYRWGESEDAQSLLDDFYGDDDLVYMKDGGDEDDTNLLPGVSIWTNLNFVEQDIKMDLDLDGKDDFVTKTKLDTNLPVMLNVYTGEIVPGLKAYGLFYANLSPKAQNHAYLTGGDPDAFVIPEPMQIGLAASYDIAVGDMTVTPKAGMLFDYAKATSKGLDAKNNPNEYQTTTTFKPEIAVDIAGAVSNTTFTVAWADAYFTTTEAGADGIDPKKTETESKGEITLKAKIAL